ncbi:AraC family transcriptional regulator [Brumimicrobium aurantiacum]|uniref:AraC family transcriptional regulator n=1 Tax=Brumimicrobium aurantiacum TaxID=1737063 RepID=A0A3E1EWZ1_9FLAO|nr:AraC family transcriptional regulator [Brumimicrobium aurantiacum]RFC54069.1 AraC family transcriptional regulator [Brumimicrobium aurantiacum]
MTKTLHIKNMVCPRCIAAVEKVMLQLEIPVEKVELGQVYLKHVLNDDQLKQLMTALQTLGFELLSSKNAQLISEIKTLIIEQIHHKKEPLTQNFSAFLSEELGYDYSYLSRLFSNMEKITINRFIVVQKIEKVKELLSYGQLSSAEIAHQLNYNSVAYLSGIFKKETGMTLTEYKESNDLKRKGIGGW